MKALELTGQRFGRLTVVKRVENNKHNQTYWLCKCDCGNETIVRGEHLKNNITKSCGCLSIEKLKRRNTTHNLTNNKLYRVYKSMHNRCENKNVKNFNNYGGRGITVCNRWSGKEGIVNFIKDMGQPPTSEYSIDRIDNSKGYSPDNCRWATPKQQARNVRNNRIITYKGNTHCLSEWCEILSLPMKTVHCRLNVLHWSIEKALTTPIRKCKRKEKNT